MACSLLHKYGQKGPGLVDFKHCHGLPFVLSRRLGGGIGLEIFMGLLHFFKNSIRRKQLILCTTF
ncbi:DNA excision repair protein ERCC-6-like protein [Corchorus olitorius]|uniref:DNA excision repair protein ERCC-6-like protein n=1 Tax=Corchorus olitorius TaxID=93759 RepID=A0A1R3K8U0_9ROSI|nr:DNA excision repair protein ERCC-6-like protein [Corchorus olitorius]